SDTDLFSETHRITIPDRIRDVEEWGDVVDREFRSVGYWFNQHPIDAYLPRLKHTGVRRKSSLLAYMQSKGLAEMAGRKLCGLVEEGGRRGSRRGNAYVSASIAEKRDVVNKIMFFGSEAFSLDRIRQTLEGAKASRKPVVIVAGLALDSRGDDLAV